MKKMGMITSVALLLMVNTWAFDSKVECKSLEDEKTMITLYESNEGEGNLAYGLLQSDESLALAGSIKVNFYAISYSLVDHLEQHHSLEISKELPPNHCRSRVCKPTPPTFPKYKKAILTSGDSVEYFKCL